MSNRVVVVGADAAGMSAASQAKRLDPSLEVVALDRGAYASYSACGIPYWVAGDVDDVDTLIARTPEEHRRRGIDLRLHHEVMELDTAAGEVRVRDLERGEDYSLGYDSLVLATGATPRRPDVEGIDAPGVFGVQTLGDGAAILEHLRTRDPKRAVVLGGGYIGVEMAEAMVRRGLQVTVVDRSPQPMSTLDPDMGALVRTAMCGLGIEVRTSTVVRSVETGADGWVRAVVTDDGEIPADLVVLGTGVRPGTDLARDAGLPLGHFGGLYTDLQMRVPGADGVWAAGDCVESLDLVSGKRMHAALGTHANKQGRTAGTNIGGGYATFPGVVGTAVSKVCTLQIARTGLREFECDAVGFRWFAVHVESTTAAGYHPEAEDVTVKLLAEQRTGRLLGAQIVGGDGAAKRIDACAVALWNRMTVEEMTALDLGYAPPFSPVWDPVLIAARKAADRLRTS
ncbi:NADPH-dependent 2,4-dienoyl-CoA reductase/sulfur reductase-like enzyme [Motilibacter peucedani]|uniref:NADPH-dependent 2,4-dienoyl-CoA reductase/sulfur reductase-like enzyme n=1 Tax=Motilibacter peucedani TaxID=598650 RepID=A0A420XV64_9ACTN|nr:FAD-dependent oxidoreductase [Motilibacter peucedani]RKS80549.1 NADPH-dependent 2,4-dienoyl-CoA reductase/sulfur reductase-like enzyme [Motilibacter peucedani]